MLSWPAVIILVLLVGYIVSETVGPTIKEGFTVVQRSDVGLASDGWGEPQGYVRDLRYTETFVDLQGLGVAADFCRAVAKKSDPDTLRISCAMGRREGMDTMEYSTRTKGEGFIFSRDDYWRAQPSGKRMDYCRILKDEITGEYYASCAIASFDGFKEKEERDSSPPEAIQRLLIAYQGLLTWYRWFDDAEDSTGNTQIELYGKAIKPKTLKPLLSRGLQLNRWTSAEQAIGSTPPPLDDYVRWGEKGTLELQEIIRPRRIRAFSCWVYWDAFEKGALILDFANVVDKIRKKDQILLGVEGGGRMLLPIPCTTPAQEVRPEVGQAICPRSEPMQPPTPFVSLSKSARYFFEIWDKESRIMRLEAPMSSAKVGRWQHIAVTTIDSTTWWPTWQMYIDGQLVAEKQDGRMSPAIEIAQNYIGTNMRGCIQDFRVYNSPLTGEKLLAAISFQKAKLHPNP